jgi:hypothetical protein
MPTAYTVKIFLHYPILSYPILSHPILCTWHKLYWCQRCGIRARAEVKVSTLTSGELSQMGGTAWRCVRATRISSNRFDPVCFYNSIPFHSIPFHSIPFHSLRIPPMSCHVMSCHVMSCHVMSCHVMSCHVMWRDESCHALSYQPFHILLRRAPIPVMCDIMGRCGLLSSDMMCRWHYCHTPATVYSSVPILCNGHEDALHGLIAAITRFSSGRRTHCGLKIGEIIITLSASLTT